MPTQRNLKSSISVLRPLSQCCLQLIVILLFEQTVLEYQAGLCNSSVFGQRSWDLLAIMFCPWWTDTVSTQSPFLQREFLQRLCLSTDQATAVWGEEGISLTSPSHQLQGAMRRSPEGQWVVLSLENCRAFKMGFWTHVLLSLKYPNIWSQNILSESCSKELSLLCKLQIALVLLVLKSVYFSKKTFYRKGNSRIQY